MTKIPKQQTTWSALDFLEKNEQETNAQKSELERRAELRRKLAAEQAKKQSSITTANDKQDQEIEARKEKARKEVQNRANYEKEQQRILSQNRPLMSGQLSGAQDFIGYMLPGYSTLMFADDASKHSQIVGSAIKNRQWGAAAGNAIKVPADIAMGAVSLIPFAGAAVKGGNKLVQETQKAISSIKSRYPLAENSSQGKFNLSLSSKEQQALNEEVARVFSESGQPVNTTTDMFGESIPDAKSEWIKFIKQQVNKNKNFGQGVWHIDHVNNIPKNNILTDGREYQYTQWDVSSDIRNGHIGSHTPEAHNVIYYFPFGSKGSDIVLNSPIAPSGHMNYKKVGPIDISEAVKYKWNGKSWIQENNLTQYAKGGNIKRNNISKREISTIVKKPFEDWYKTVPADRNDTITYNLRRAYELAPIDELETWRTSSFEDLKSGKNHLKTVYFNPDTGIYEFMKSKDHKSLQSELDWFYSNDPEAIEFRNNYYLDTNNDFYKYLPKKKSGGRIHIKPENRGKFTEYCGGKVTDECIQRAKRSGNKKLIKRAVFAQNSRSWSKKHFLGGQLI